MRATRATWAALSIIAFMAAGAVPGVGATDPSGDWPMFKGDASRTGVGLDGPDDGPVVRWRYSADAPFSGSLSVVGDHVFASSIDGVLHVLDAGTGTERWRYEPGFLVSPPTVVDGVVYTFIDGSDLVALDATSGDVRWTALDVVSGPTDPTAGDGALYIGSDAGDLVAIGLANGIERWRTRVSDVGGAAHRPAFADGHVFVAADGGGLAALDARDGAIEWRFDTGPFETGGAVVADGTAFIGSGPSATDGRLWAVDAATGELRWVVDAPYHGPAVADGVAYSGSGGIGVAAHDAATGNELWTFPVDGVARPLAVAEGVLYVPVDGEARLYALDASTGAERWRVDLDQSMECCVAVAHGSAYVGTYAGSLYAIGGADSEVAARPDPTSAPTVVLANPFTVVETLDPSETGLAGAASMAFGPDGNLYVAQNDPPRISVLSTTGKPIRSWGAAGSGPGELDFADTWASITVAPDGLVYLTESGNSRVSVFEPDGRFVRHIGAFGTAPGRFLKPFGVVADASGNVFVMDDTNQSISMFDSTGTFGWRSDELGDPDLIGYFHRGGLDADGRLWVANDSSAMALAIGAGGEKLEIWDAQGDTLGLDFIGPCQIRFDGAGNAYVLDCSNQVIAVFDPSHRLVGAWVEPGATGLPFGHGYDFGPDGRLYALAGGDRGGGGPVEEPDAIVVMDVASPNAQPS